MSHLKTAQNSLIGLQGDQATVLVQNFINEDKHARHECKRIEQENLQLANQGDQRFNENCVKLNLLI